MGRLHVYKARPAHWAEGPEVGRHETSWGICDLEEKGREITTKWILNGPKPVQVRSKRKHRRPV